MVQVLAAIPKPDCNTEGIPHNLSEQSGLVRRKYGGAPVLSGLRGQRTNQDNHTILAVEDYVQLFEGSFHRGYVWQSVSE